MAEQLITVNSTAEGAALCGSYDRNLDILRKEYQVELILQVKIAIKLLIRGLETETA